MERIIRALCRRSLLKIFLALPLVRLVERYLVPLIGLGSDAAIASSPLKVAKVSDLSQPWSFASFTYNVKIKTKDVHKKDVVIDESVPGVVIRLPDEVASKRGEGMKGRFDVINLHCTHERCVGAYLTDASEIRAVSAVEAKSPVVYCPCHRSVFDIARGGKPVKGPAKEPLWKFEFEVKGGDIIITGMDSKASRWAPGRPGALGAEYPVRPGERGL